MTRDTFKRDTLNSTKVTLLTLRSILQLRKLSLNKAVQWSAMKMCVWWAICLHETVMTRNLLLLTAACYRVYYSRISRCTRNTDSDGHRWSTDQPPAALECLLLACGSFSQYAEHLFSHNWGVIQCEASFPRKFWRPLAHQSYPDWMRSFDGYCDGRRQRRWVCGQGRKLMCADRLLVDLSTLRAATGSQF